MRTTLNIPDELYRRVRIRAAEGGVTVTSVVEDALLRLLEQHGGAVAAVPFRMPVLDGSGAVLAGIDLNNNAALRDLMEDGVLREKLR